MPPFLKFYIHAIPNMTYRISTPYLNFTELLLCAQKTISQAIDEYYKRFSKTFHTTKL